MLKKEFIGYATDLKVLGGIAVIDYLNDEVVLVNGNGAFEKSTIANVVLLEQVGKINGKKIFNHDVLVGANGLQYEIELHTDGKLQLHVLDKKLERVKSGEKFTEDKLDQIGKHITLVGNIYELLNTLNVVDFNIEIVRGKANGHLKYFYACNNEALEQIDLIDVVFMGHHLLKEEKYARETISHEEYLERIEEKQLVVVTPQELANYVTGAKYGQVEEEDVEEDVLFDEDEEELDDEDYCDECNEHKEDCDCDLW